MKQFFAFFFLFCIYCGAVSGDCTGNLSQAEYDSLFSLFNQTNGIDWRWDETLPSFTRWNFPEYGSGVNLPCNYRWQGVNCTIFQNSCTVQSISLVNYNLSGEIPNSIGNFLNLIQLDLSNNALISFIPTGVLYLQNLLNLNLSCNSLSATIPPIELANLESLELRSNKITGSVPSSIGSMSKLEYLMLVSNFLTNDIPSSLLSLPNLLFLDLSSNMLTGISYTAEDYRATKLTTLSLSSNLIRGTLPPQLCNLTNLVALLVDENLFSSTIPSTLGSLTKLEVLYLYNNVFTGLVPSSLGQLKLCVEFELSTNSLTGTIPPSFGSFEQMIYLYLDFNFMTGTIPTQLFSLARLENLLLYLNYLTGEIPSALGQLESLEYLLMDDNFLSGSLSSSLSALANLSQLIVQYNMLSGSIPSTIGGLTTLEKLNLYANYLTGSLPDGLSNLGNLQQLRLYSNDLTGTVPSSLRALTNLNDLQMQQNLLSGSIPPCLGSMLKLTYLNLAENNFQCNLSVLLLTSLQSLNYLNLSFNALTGPVPSSLALMPALAQVILSSNSFSGAIPTAISALPNLFLLEMNACGLTGTLPPQLGNLTSLSELLLAGNGLVGAIPSQLALISAMTALDLSSNSLSGTVPAALGNLALLQYLNLSNNAFTGALTIAFDGAKASYSALTLVDLSQNALTGTISPFLFQLPHLENLALYGNCFSGSIPAEICNAKNLTVLILDGLTSGSSCLVRLPVLLQQILRGSFTKQLMQGSIPSCVWSLPQLQTLHLAGNGLTGSIGEIPLSSQLIDLSVSNNLLSGSIPISIQTYANWRRLVLSANKLSGTLVSDFVISNSTNAVVNMFTNRISGPIPAAITSAGPGVINVLEGNLFSCNADNIPVNDPAAKSYICGSDDLDTSLYVWISAVTTIAACASIAVFVNQQAKIRRVQYPGGTAASEQTALENALAIVFLQTNKWWTTALAIPDLSENYAKFFDVIRRANRASVILLILYLAICLLVYLLLKSVDSLAAAYSTVTYQYGWMVTCAYLHGLLPTGLMLFFVCISICWISLVLVDRRESEVLTGLPLPDPAALIASARADAFLMSVKKRCKSFFSFANLRYAFAAVMVNAVNIATMLTVDALYIEASLTELTPTELVFVQAAVGTFKVVWGASYVPWAVKLIDKQKHAMLNELSMSIFNQIVAPALASLVISSSCLLYAFTGEAAVNATFSLYAETFQTCSTTYTTVDVTEQVASTSCVGNYEQIQLQTSLVPAWTYSHQCSSKVIVKFVPVLVFSYALTGVALPLLYFCVAQFEPSEMEKFMGRTIYGSIPEILRSPYAYAGVNPSGLFRGTRLVLKVLVDFAVLISFGLASPLLAVVVVVKILVQAALTMLLLGRYLDPSGVLSEFRAQRVEQATRGCDDRGAEGMLIVVGYVSVLWAVVVFDFVSDIYGNAVGGWSVGVAVLLMWLCCGGALVANKRYKTAVRSLLWRQILVACCLRSGLLVLEFTRYFYGPREIAEPSEVPTARFDGGHDDGISRTENDYGVEFELPAKPTNAVVMNPVQERDESDIL